MAKNKKVHRYVRVRYDKEEDAFIIEITDDTQPEWDTYLRAKCFHAVKEDGTPTDSADFIHYSFLNELQRAVALGYEFVVNW